MEVFDYANGTKHDWFKARDSFALALRRVSRFDEAIKVMRETLERQEKELEENDPDTLSTLNELGYAMLLKGDAVRAEEILREAKMRREQRLTPKAGLTRHTYQNLAKCLTRLGKYDEAEELYEKAYNGHKAMFGTEDHHWMVHIKGNIAELKEKQGKLEEAMQLFRDVKEWREKDVKFGPEHPDTLRACVSLVMVYYKMGRQDDAMQLALKTRDQYIKAMVAEHHETRELETLIERMRQRVPLPQ